MTETALRTVVQTVPIRGLTDALRGLWKLCRSAEPDDSISRALTMNLIAVTPSSEADALRASMDRLLRRLPCRAFLVHLDAERLGLSAQVCGATRSLRGTREIVLEQIELQAHASDEGALPGVIRPLLVNDIPTHLFWNQALTKDPSPFLHLLDLCDHAVVDSALFHDPAAELDFVRTRSTERRPITDLSALRLRPWRRALAAGLEHVPWRADVPTTATVRHGLNAGAQACGLQLARWLQERLRATVELVAGEVDDRPTPDGVELHNGDSAVRVSRTDGQLQIVVTTRDSCFLPFQIAASRGTQADLLAAAIDLA